METIKLDLIPGKKMPSLHASQYDDGRAYHIDLTENRVPYVLDGTETISLTVRKCDNTLATMDIANTFADKSYIEFITTEQMTACAGFNYGEITLEKNGDKISSLNFYLQVEGAPDEGGITSQSEINNLARQVHDIVVEELADHGAEDTGYDNTESGLEATNVQDAIDEVNTKIEDIPSVDAYTKEETDEKFATKTALQTVANAVDDKASAEDLTKTEAKVNSVYGEVYGAYTPAYLDGMITVYNNKAVYNVSNDWVYVVLNVTNFIGTKLTISTYADRSRKIIFADNSENVIDTVTIDTGNPNLYSTVEATVPQGATKCYIDKYKSGSNDIVVVGYYVPKLALKTEVPTIATDFGDSDTAGISQKFITDSFGNSIEKVCPINNKLPMIDEDVPIYLDNLFRGISPKETKLVEVNNANVHIYDKTVAVLPHNGGASARIRLHLIDDFKYEKFADVTFASTIEKTASKKVLFIGDSMTENLSYLNPLKTLSDNGNYNLTFLGTQGTTIKHEGRGGWAAYNYCNDASYSGKTNAFWDGSKFNFAWYISQNNIDAPDYVFINLGTNDLIRGITNPSDDEEVKSVVISSYETMINSIHSYNANIPIVLWLPPTRCMAGRNNHTAIDNSLRINRFLIEKFDKNSYINAKVYLMHTYLFVNPYTDYTISNVTVNGITYEDCSEPIHPTQSGGGEKIASGIMRQMMYIDGL